MILTLNVIHAGFGGEDSLNLPLMDPSLEAYLLQKDEESDEVRNQLVELKSRPFDTCTHPVNLHPMFLF
jgi:hypothetical protein